MKEKMNKMKNLIIMFTVFLFFWMSKYASADEFITSNFEFSTFETAFENVEMKNKTDFSFADSSINTSRLHFISLAALPTGEVDSGGKSTYVSSSQNASPRKYLELTPMWGYTFGGKFENEENDETIKISEGSSFGFRMAYDYEHNSQIEFLYSHQETELTGGDLFPKDALFDLDIDYFHIGGSLLWGKDKWQPYLTGSLGLTHFNPEDSGIDSLTRFSMGFGGGVRYFPTERLGLYLGARGLVTFVNSEIEAYSGSEGSYTKIEADTLWQFQVFAGLVFVF